MQKDALIEKLRNLLSSEQVISDPKDCEFFAQDIYGQGSAVPVVISPATEDQLAESLRLIDEAEFCVAARGGGMSYTGGYLQDRTDVALVDMSALDQVVEINAEDMYVRVQAGCTWSSLHQALSEAGLRTPFWGTLSGGTATIGGVLSQNGLFYGSGQYGAAADSVLCLTVALAGGKLMRTGSSAIPDGTPFFRHFGPDLTGLFLGDTGALGIKTELTLRLVPVPEFVGHASFEFDSYEQCTDAISAISRLEVATETVAFDPVLAGMRMKRESLSKDLGALANVVKNSGSKLAGLKDIVSIAIAGRDYIGEHKYSMHITTEASSRHALQDNLEKLRKTGIQFGSEIPNSIPKLIRSYPFPVLNNIVGATGERWLPIHGIVPHSKAKETWGKIYALFAEHQEAMTKHEVEVGFFVSSVSTNGFLLEPSIYWPGELYPLHEQTMDASVLDRLPRHAPNQEAAAIVATLRESLCQLFLNSGATHFQIARTYLYKEGMSEENWTFLKGIKSLLDPKGRLNPGSLGLN